jgi:hypothetical protein
MGRCSDPEHAPNIADISFQRTIISGAERLRKALGDQLLVNGVLNFKVLNPLWLMAGEKTTDKALQEKIYQLRDTDPVHVLEAGFTKLGLALEFAAGEMLHSGGGSVKKTNTSHTSRWPEWLPNRAIASSTFRGRWQTRNPASRPPSRGRGWARPRRCTGFTKRPHWPY